MQKLWGKYSLMEPTIKKLRSRGERLALFFSFALVVFTATIVFQINIWLILAAILLQLIYVTISQKQLIGDSLQVTKDQFTDIYEIAKENAKQLNIRRPKIFLYQDPYINAYTIGFFPPYAIVLNSALVESLSRDELDFVIGHEMGHIRFGHSKYLSFISPIGRNIPFISWLYSSWQRKSEYTADRVGYIVTDKIKPAISTMIKTTVGLKLSKLVNIDELVKQIQKGESGLLTKTGELLLTHPYTTNRIKALVVFSKFGEK